MSLFQERTSEKTTWWFWFRFRTGSRFEQQQARVRESIRSRNQSRAWLVDISLSLCLSCNILLFISHARILFIKLGYGYTFQALECQIVPFRSEHLRITIQSEGEGNDTIFVDAVELFHGGPTPAERAVSSIVGFMDKPRSMPSKVQPTSVW